MDVVCLWRVKESMEKLLIFVPQSAGHIFTIIRSCFYVKYTHMTGKAIGPRAVINQWSICLKGLLESI